MDKELDRKKVDSDGKPYPATFNRTSRDNEGGVSWQQHRGNKDSYYNVAEQMNSKSNGVHTFYEPQSGKSGAAFDDRKK